MTPEALLTQLRSTRDGDERRALTEAILELGYPWALELDAEHLALVRRRQSVRSWTWVLGGCWTVVSLSLGLALANLGDLVEEAPPRRRPAPATARAAFVELNASRVARSVSSIERLLREGQRLAARDAALRCLVIDYRSARCAELYVATLQDMEAARGQRVLRTARDARLEVLAFIAGTSKWKDGSDATDEAACRVLMADVRPFFRSRMRSLCADGPCEPLLNDATHVDGVAVRSAVLPACANRVLAERLERAGRIGDRWDLNDVVVWQNAMESATLQVVDGPRLDSRLEQQHLVEAP